MSMINLKNIEWQTFANNILDLLFYLKCRFRLTTDHDNFSNDNSGGREEKRLENSIPLKLIKTKRPIPSSISFLVLIPNDFPSAGQN